MSISNAWDTSGDYTHQYALWANTGATDVNVSLGGLRFDTGQDNIGEGTTQAAVPSWFPMTLRILSTTDCRIYAGRWMLTTNETFERLVNNTMNYLAVGTVKGHNGAMEGWMAETAVWNVGLTDRELYALHTGVRPDLIRPQNCCAYYPQRVEQGSKLYDENPGPFRRWDLANPTPSNSWPQRAQTMEHPPIIEPTGREIRRWLNPVKKSVFIPTPKWEEAATDTSYYTFRAAGAVSYNTNGGSGNTLSPGAPTGKASNDLLILYTAQRVAEGTLNATPTGWTVLGGYTAVGDTWTISVLGRIADGGVNDTPSGFYWSGDTQDNIAWIEAYYGDVYTDLGAIVADTATSEYSNQVKDLNVPAFTWSTGVDNSLLLICGFRQKSNLPDTATTPPSTITAPGSFTKSFQHIQTGSGALMAASGYWQQTTASNHDGANFTTNVSADGEENQPSAGVLIALKTSSKSLVNPYQVFGKKFIGGGG